MADVTVRKKHATQRKFFIRGSAMQLIKLLANIRRSIEYVLGFAFFVDDGYRTRQAP
jgi:hypothetical protein